MNEKLKAAAEEGIIAVLDLIWAERYVPELNAQIQREAELRADAFSDATFEVFGEELRQMTPHDLVLLEGIDSPFVAGGAEPTFGDITFFLWALHEHNDPARPVRTGWLRGRAKARIARACEELGEDAAILEIFGYIDRVFIDLPSLGPKNERDAKPPAVHCVAPLLVEVAATVGPRDPMSGRFLGDTPISRLIQYRRAADLRKGGKNEFTAIDSARVACMAEANEVMLQHRAEKERAP